MGFKVIKDNYTERARERIVNSRNILREYAIENDYDFFFSLEQDVIPPNDAVDRLINHKKDVVTGVYFTNYLINNEPVLKLLLWVKNPETYQLEFIDDSFLDSNNIIRINASGLGCVLIHRIVLEKIKFRLFDEKNTFDDMPFYKDLDNNGIQAYADLGLRFKHMITGMNWDKIKE